MKWGEVKQGGSSHYKSGSVEPIDLYKSGGLLQGYCIASIIKYAFRNRPEIADIKDVSEKDLRKIVHCAHLLIAASMEARRDEHTGSSTGGEGEQGDGAGYEVAF